MTRGIIDRKTHLDDLRDGPILFIVGNPRRGYGDMLSTERPNLSYARRGDAALFISEALGLAHQLEALLEEAAKDPSVDAYALRMALGLARSLIVELGERPASEPRLAHGPLGKSSTRVA
jgi:hypothetical protein